MCSQVLIVHYHYLHLYLLKHEYEAQSICLGSFTLLLCELDSGVGVSLSWLGSIGDCGRKHKMQSRQMNICVYDCETRML